MKLKTIKAPYFVIFGLVLVLVIIFLFQKRSLVLSSNSPVLFKKNATFGECSDYCKRFVVLHENGLLELRKEDILSKKTEEAKFVLNKNELTQVRDSISKSGILAKNCNVNGLMDAWREYEISLDGKSISFKEGYDPEKANEKTDNCSLDLEKIEEAIGHQDW